MSEFMRNYEVTFIVDPVLSGDEIKATAQTYIDQLEKEGCTIVFVDEMGLRTLAYPIKNRHSGVYFCVEYSAADGSMIDKIELALRRDERIMRFLTVALDKYGVKYNDDKRNGLIGKVVVKKKESKSDSRGGRDNRDNRGSRGPRKEAPVAKVEKKEAPVAKVEKKEAPAPKVEKKEAPAPKVEKKETPVAEAPVADAPAVEEKAPETPATETKVDEGTKD